MDAFISSKLFIKIGKKYKNKIRKHFIKQKRCFYYKGIVIKLIICSFCVFILWFYLHFYKIQFSIYKNFTTSEKYKEQIIIPDLKPLVNQKLYWNNKTSIEIDKIREEIKTIENLEISYDNPDDFKKRKNPKVSLIIAIYNERHFIKTIYSTILKQELKDIEIIFIDDASKDNSVDYIKELMEKDKRIVLLQNKENKKAFYSRNKGILNAKGEYVLIIDPDDYLINNILIKAYETAHKYQLDILQFYMMIGKVENPNWWRDLKYSDGVLIGNAEVRKVFYYCISRNLVDKLVKREVFVKSIKFMKEEFYNENYERNDDDTAFFGLVHVAETYGFLEEIGYLYKEHGSEKYNTRTDPKRINIVMRSLFNIMKYFYFQSDNNQLEKNNMAYSYFEKSIGFIKENINIVTEGFDYFGEILDIYYNSTYFKEGQKTNIKDIKEIIINRKNEIKGYI